MSFERDLLTEVDEKRLVTGGLEANIGEKLYVHRGESISQPTLRRSDAKLVWRVSFPLHRFPGLDREVLLGGSSKFAKNLTVRAHELNNWLSVRTHRQENSYLSFGVPQLQSDRSICGPSQFHPLHVTSMSCEELSPGCILLLHWKLFDGLVRFTLFLDRVVPLVQHRYARELLLALLPSINRKNLILLILVKTKMSVILD